MKTLIETGIGHTILPHDSVRNDRQVNLHCTRIIEPRFPSRMFLAYPEKPPLSRGATAVRVALVGSGPIEGDSSKKREPRLSCGYSAARHGMARDTRPHGNQETAGAIAPSVTSRLFTIALLCYRSLVRPPSPWAGRIPLTVLTWRSNNEPSGRSCGMQARLPRQVESASGSAKTDRPISSANS